MQSRFPHPHKRPAAWCRGVGVLATSIVLAGCGVRATITDHVADSTYPGHPQRMIVVDALDRAYTPKAPEKFQAAITDDLARCGVETRVFLPGTLDLNGETLRRVEATFHADSILDMHQATRRIEGFDTVAGTYLLTLRDLDRKHEVWKAMLAMTGGSALIKDREAEAAESAHKVVQQMAQDGVLRGCDPAMTAPPAGR